MSDSALHKDRSGIAAVMSVALAAVSAFFFLSHVVLFLFPILPIGAWLGWEGRASSGYRALGWAGFLLCGAMSVVLLVMLVAAVTR